MDGLAYAAALVLAATFAWAGVAKLVARQRTLAAFTALRVPAPDVLARAVPSVELVLAAGLVVVPGWAAVAALALLAGFTTFLVRGVRGGVVVGCGCFGAPGDAPLSSADLVRNGALLLAAAVAATADGPSLPSVAAVGGAGTALAVTCYTVTRMRRQVR